MEVEVFIVFALGAHGFMCVPYLLGSHNDSCEPVLCRTGMNKWQQLCSKFRSCNQKWWPHWYNGHRVARNLVFIRIHLTPTSSLFWSLFVQLYCPPVFSMVLVSILPSGLVSWTEELEWDNEKQIYLWFLQLTRLSAVKFLNPSALT